MNLSNATKRQLYEVAVDHDTPLELRYKAARELQRKVGDNLICKYPSCTRKATSTFALVPLCGDHYDDIHAETIRYYRVTTKMQYAEREHYLKIAKLIPWSRINMGEVLPDGSVRRD
ncbi:hypothetical protein [Paenibacillus ginsengihumi]|uniref:hypothetical protein n=1 Tax=Paenibacillus ginsengihumi TaxID=431596 RepID=UPI0003734516|nr:hypothetical protein [Paenibacillus ginsengihumi]